MLHATQPHAFYCSHLAPARLAYRETFGQSDDAKNWTADWGSRSAAEKATEPKTVDSTVDDWGAKLAAHKAALAAQHAEMLKTLAASESDSAANQRPATPATTPKPLVSQPALATAAKPKPKAATPAAHHHQATWNATAQLGSVVDSLQKNSTKHAFSSQRHHSPAAPAASSTGSLNIELFHDPKSQAELTKSEVDKKAAIAENRKTIAKFSQTLLKVFEEGDFKKIAIEQVLTVTQQFMALENMLNPNFNQPKKSDQTLVYTPVKGRPRTIFYGGGIRVGIADSGTITVEVTMQGIHVSAVLQPGSEAKVDLKVKDGPYFRPFEYNPSFLLKLKSLAERVRIFDKHQMDLLEESQPNWQKQQLAREQAEAHRAFVGVQRTEMEFALA